MGKKKWKKFFKIILIVLIILFVIALINFIRKKTSKHDKIDDFIDLKELVEYIGCDYYKSTASDEEGYEGDYYIKFSVDPIDESLPATNKLKYENVILSIEEFLKYKNIRIIDESRKLVIRTNCIKDKQQVNYTINGVTGYFERLLAKTQVEQNKEKVSNLEIVSPELNSIIKVNWVRRNASLGTIDRSSTAEYNYDHYDDEGYSTRVVGTKIFNVVFKEKYNKEVVRGVKPGMKPSEVASVLGEPTYKQIDNIDNCEYIGYKLSSCYIFFSDVISVYPVVEFDETKNEQFAEAVSNFRNGGSKSDFMKKVTEIYPNYSAMVTIEDKNYTRIEYPLYGFYVFLSDNYNLIDIYNTYQGKVDSETTVDELKLGLKSVSLVQTKFHKNALEIQESERIEASR